MELITTFMPRPITCEAELTATQNRINYILDRSNISQDDRDYLNVLGTLVYDYEQKHEIMPVVKGVKLLRALIVEDNLEAKDLIGIWENEVQVSEVLDGEREMTATQMQKLAEFFHVSAAAFLE